MICEDQLDIEVKGCCVGISSIASVENNRMCFVRDFYDRKYILTILDSAKKNDSYKISGL